MKICWDNIENFYLSSRGNLTNGIRPYYERACKNCSDPFLSERRANQFCSTDCWYEHMREEGNHPKWTDGLSKIDRSAYMVIYDKKWLQNNLDKHSANSARRRAHKLSQTPDDADTTVIIWYYEIAQQMSKRIGIPGFYHVDHIRPLSKEGLHHEDNLQILTARQNIMKGSTLAPTTDNQ